MLPSISLLDHDLLRPDSVLYLIELPLILDRVVILEGPFYLDAEDGIELDAFDRAVEVLFLLRCHTEAPVVDRQIGREEPICLRYRAHTLKPHLLDHPVLEGLEQPLDPSLGLKESGHGAF